MRWERLPGVVVAISPGVAAACGQCAETSLLRHGWWMHLPIWLLGGLLLDAASQWVVNRATPSPEPAKKWLLLRKFGQTGAALVLLFGLVFLASVFGPTVTAVLAVLMLSHRFVTSIVRQGPGWRRTMRPLLIACAVGILAFRARPGALSSPELVRTAAQWLRGVERGQSAATWAERELMRRPDAVTAVEAALADSSDEWEVLRLHMRIGGRVEVRESFCSARDQAGRLHSARELCPSWYAAKEAELR